MNIGHSDETALRRSIIFLSSVFWETVDGAKRPLSLRAGVIERCSKLGIDLRAHTISRSNSEESANSILDRCFADIKDCDLFAYLQTTRHGSKVQYPEASTSIATYLEMELFAAAMLEKPILVLHERNTQPDPQLHDLLNLLKRSFSGRFYKVGDELDLLDAFVSEVRQLLASPADLSEFAARRIPDGLSMLRSRTSLVDDLNAPKLRFLGQSPKPLVIIGDPEIARRLLDSVSNSDALTQKPMSHGAALFRIWAAIREFLALDLRDPAVAQLWDRALGLWSTKASWFGIHGHIFLGPLAAINSQIELRQSLRDLELAIDAREPIGAKASALYSVAQRMSTRSRQLVHYEQAAVQATRAIASNPDSSSGPLSVRGHAHLRIARLGRPWRLFDARQDFKSSLTFRERTGASPHSIGEAEADLGLVMILTGQPFKGMSRLRHGVELMRYDQSPNGRAFLARGLRKLEQGARLTMRRSLCEEARRERFAIAMEIDAVDQMRKG